MRRAETFEEEEELRTPLLACRGSAADRYPVRRRRGRLERHVNPRTTMRYGRARVSLGRHATCIVATCIVGAPPASSRTLPRPAEFATARPAQRAGRPRSARRADVTGRVWVLEAVWPNDRPIGYAG